MNDLKSWNSLRIKELFLSSIPGDWGTESTPEHGIPVLRSTNFCNDGSINFTDLAFRKINSERLLKRLVDKDTILIEKSGGSPTQPAGRVVFCNKDFKGTASNFIEIVKIKEEFSPKFVSFLLYHLYQLGLVHKYQQQTTGIINFKLGEYSEELVLLPKSKSEQSKIAEVLSKVDEAIEQTESLIAKQERIKTGLMQDLLTRGIDEQGNLRSEETHEFKDSTLGRIPVEWEMQPFNECVFIVVGQIDPRKLPYREWILIAPDHVESKTGRLFETKTAFEQNAISGKYEFKNGDVVYSKIRPYLRKAVQVNFNGLCSADMYPLRPKESLTSDFLFLTILSEPFSLYAESVSERSGFPKINRSELSDFQIATPKIEEQLRISEFFKGQIQNVERLKKSLIKLRSFKNALMQDLLSAKVRVTPLLKKNS